LRIERLEDRRLLSITVTNLDDAGPGSLRAAIMQANDEAGPETIEFDAALVGTIELTSGELDITDSLTINGPGQDVVTIDVKGQSRVFNIDDGTASRIDVEIGGLTITGGKTIFSGGGIFNREILTVTGSTISGNTAGQGGAIYAEADVALVNSTISGNSAGTQGGGIYAYDADVTVIGSTVSGNIAGRSGGGIHVETDDPDVVVTITDSTISGNTSGSRGGGIYADDGDVTLTHSTISGNTAVEIGGGLFISGSDLTVSNSTISENRSVGGGGIFFEGGVEDGDQLTVLDSTISNNVASENGGGIKSNYSNVTVTRSTISGNTAASDWGGGGIDIKRGDLTVTHSIISENTAGVGGGISFRDGRMILADSVVKDNKAVGRESSGGGLRLRSAHVTVTRSTISGNTTDDDSGGGIDSGYSDLTVIDSTISGNTTNSDGGGIYSDYSDLRVIRSTISGNTANNEGGGIYAIAGGGIDRTVTVTDSTISGNIAGLGGGIYALSEFGAKLALTVSGSTISGNTSAGAGGGIYARVGGDDGDLTLAVTLSTISGNTAGDEGGGIFGSDDVTVANSTISGNTAGDRGGGIYVEDGNVMVASSTISGNTANTRGGGVYVEEGDVSVTGSTISGNMANIRGGGVYIEDGDVLVTDSTISGNMGGGIITQSGNVTVTDSTISGNTAGISGGGIYAYGNVTVMGSTISGNVARDVAGGIYAHTEERDVAVTVTGSTISGNTAGNGGAIHAASSEEDATVTVTGSILSGNTATDAGAQETRDVGGVFLFDANYSVIGDAAAARIDIGGNNISDNSPLLAPLADNGGPTQTHALLPGSPAIDLGDPDFVPPPAFDQRGGLRVIDGNGDGTARIDIGAFEQQTISLVVDTTTDESDGEFGPGDLSLREAIELANNSFGRDTISFDTAGVFGAAQTILLTMGELAITDALTIDGPGADLLTIDADQQSRVFYMDDGHEETHIGVQLASLTVTGGRNETVIDDVFNAALHGIIAGGGIFTRENLTVIDSTISGNLAILGDETGDAYGGGVLVEDANLTLIRSTVSGNTSGQEDGDDYGGGIALLKSGTLTVTDSTISGNTASGDGGGIYVADVRSIYSNLTRRVVISNSTISGNTSRNLGGGLAMKRGSLIVTDSTIAENISEGGGGFFIDGGHTTIANSTITGNAADGEESAGGGILIEGDAQVSVSNSTISDNTVAGRGGGIFSEDSDTTVTHSTISGNAAGEGGGGIFVEESGSLQTLFSTITENLNGGIGRVVHPFRPANLHVSGSIISGNLGGPDIGDGFNTVTQEFSLVGGPDPLLGPLKDNGGLTQTHALLPGSPAIDAGDPGAVAGENGVPLFDQRGAPFARVVNGRIDIGAFEFGAANPADLTGNGFVDFQDLTILLANWNQSVSAAEGNLVDATGTPVDFADLTTLLAAWTGPGGAASPRAVLAAPVGRRLAAAQETSASVRPSSENDSERDAPRRTAVYGRREGKSSRSASGTYGRLQAVDRVFELAGDEEGDEGVIRSRAVSRRAARRRV
jgi:parallel beta-helix repeat protein/predicted outer membrane repeat protein